MSNIDNKISSLPIWRYKLQSLKRKCVCWYRRYYSAAHWHAVSV